MGSEGDRRGTDWIRFDTRGVRKGTDTPEGGGMRPERVGRWTNRAGSRTRGDPTGLGVRSGDRTEVGNEAGVKARVRLRVVSVQDWLPWRRPR